MASVETKQASLWHRMLLWGTTVRQQEILGKLRVDNHQDLISWTIFTIVLPVVTFAFAACINLLYTNYKGTVSDWGKAFNNGSLPIIAFGILSSSLPYMVEKLKPRDPHDKEVYSLRKRVLAIVVVVMFLAAGLFIIQSLNFITNNNNQNVIILTGGILVTAWATKLGRVMFLTQSLLADTLTEDMEKNAKSQREDLAAQFPKTGTDDE